MYTSCVCLFWKVCKYELRIIQGYHIYLLVKIQT